MCPFIFLGQTQIDSLRNLLVQKSTNEKDTTYILVLSELAFEYRQNNPDSALLLAQKALKIAETTNFSYSKAKIINTIGLIYNNKGDYEKAINYHREALIAAQKANNLQEVAQSYSHIANSYYMKGDYPNSLSYNEKAFPIREKLKDETGIASYYNNMGNIYHQQGNNQKSLDFHFKSLTLREKIQHKQGISASLNNIGIVYYQQGDYKKAIEYYRKATDIDKELGDKFGMSIGYNNIGEIYILQKDYAEAYKHCLLSMKISEEVDDLYGIAYSCANLGLICIRQNQLEKTQHFLEKGIKIAKDIKSDDVIAFNNSILATYHNTLKEYQKAYFIADEALNLSQKIGNVEYIKNSAEQLSISASMLKNYEKAYNSHLIYKKMEDSLQNEATHQKAMQKDFEHKEERQQLEQDKKDLAHKVELTEQKRIQNTFLGLAVTFLVIIILVAISYKQKQKANKLLATQKEEISNKNQELNQVNEELVVLNENLAKQKTTIEETYIQLKETSDELSKSIRYASHIQSIILADTQKLQQYFSDFFILYRPRDVVSGDFYWFSQISETQAVFALADCTGHGVPGAFMSMLGSTLLHETVNVKGIYDDPARVLRNLHAAFRKLLKQDESRNTDGMDISLCYFEKSAEKQTIKLNFAGAKTSMYYVENNILTVITGDRIYLGGKNSTVEFHNKTIEATQGTVFYLLSDGFADQNNADRMRFGSKPLQDLILSFSHLPFETQKQELANALDIFQGQEHQRDDISLIGLRP